MDKNYTGGWLESGRDLELSDEKLKRGVVTLQDLSGLFEDIKDGLLDRNSLDELKMKLGHLGNAVDEVQKCKNCRNYYTMNRSYGRYDCRAHYGYCDASKPGQIKWSCCGKPPSQEGCLESEHITDTSFSNYGTSSKIPTLKLPLAFLLAFTLDEFYVDRESLELKVRKSTKSPIRFISRYFWNETPTTSSNVKVVIYYLESKDYYETYRTEEVLSSTYVPHHINSIGDKIYIDLIRSCVNFPMITRSKY